MHVTRASERAGPVPMPKKTCNTAEGKLHHFWVEIFMFFWLKSLSLSWEMNGRMDPCPCGVVTSDVQLAWPKLQTKRRRSREILSYCVVKICMDGTRGKLVLLSCCWLLLAVNTYIAWAGHRPAAPLHPNGPLLAFAGRFVGNAGVPWPTIIK